MIGIGEDIPGIARDNLSKIMQINWNNLNWLHNYFNKKLGYNTSLAILSSIVRESGGDPYKKQLKGGPGRGLLQWENGTERHRHMLRYKMKDPLEKGIDPELQRQAEYIVSTVSRPQIPGEGLGDTVGRNLVINMQKMLDRNLLMHPLQPLEKLGRLVQGMYALNLRRKIRKQSYI